MNYSYRFPVVKGVQAAREYYIAMVPLGMLSKLFPNDSEFVLPEFRAQRRLNENRIPEIRKYILDNRNNYVFSALAASIDGVFQFLPNSDGETGILEVDMNARFLINDGQHRKAAILAALEEDPSLADETISVVLYEDHGLARSQQMFTDLNKHAVKTSNSLAELYDSRDPLAVATRKTVSAIPFLDEYVDKEKDNLGKYSSSLFTLNTFYVANKRILRRNPCDSDFLSFIEAYWSCVADSIRPWKELQAHEISKKELREQYVATQSVVIQALGTVGAFLYDNPQHSVWGTVPSLSGINWKRNADCWKGRIIRSDGRIINNTQAIALAAIVIKQQLRLSLTEEETENERSFQSIR